MNLSSILDRELQHRLDFLDEYIDTLEREKRATGETDLSTTDEAREIQQQARNHYSKHDFEKAWIGVYWAEGCILVGRRDLEAWVRLSAEIENVATARAR